MREWGLDISRHALHYVASSLHTAAWRACAVCICLRLYRRPRRKSFYAHIRWATVILAVGFRRWHNSMVLSLACLLVLPVPVLQLYCDLIGIALKSLFIISIKRTPIELAGCLQHADAYARYWVGATLD